MKTLKMFFLLLLIWLQYSLWWGKNGIFDYIIVYKKVIMEKKENINLDILNNQIILEINKFNNRIKNN
ncbi:MAG: cell division protein FtsB [Buchnera aphidicola (Brevicoryne brassicae)]|uniref:Cell division protein FtsB n=1 Tax=Buchnera aphidicola (Brevicoryne brassicae) TaxID=911343 RepID=A0AAJ5TX75_9GAMM|nr:cell division protein FtsB [Buchnera aphidicola]QCI19975.1 cell division protein FtsB [Buchnera aphidicola (Brevicoryne brassicae)]WAI18799.1 MAG: cell division protein FtsB [Buchnera aphidicola (Brevicoryne brassicae)]